MVVGSITSGFSVWCLLALLFEQAGDMIILLNLHLVLKINFATKIINIDAYLMNLLSVKH